MNLSLGERPVCLPVRTTSGPAAARMPSSSPMACSYSAAGERLAWRFLPKSGMSLARRTKPFAVAVVLPGLSRVVATVAVSLLSGWVRSVAHTHFHLADRPRVPGFSAGSRLTQFVECVIVRRRATRLPNHR